jgi:hypothetical protein
MTFDQMLGKGTRNAQRLCTVADICDLPITVAKVVRRSQPGRLVSA